MNAPNNNMNQPNERIYSLTQTTIAATTSYTFDTWRETGLVSAAKVLRIAARRIEARFLSKQLETMAENVVEAPNTRLLGRLREEANTMYGHVCQTLRADVVGEADLYTTHRDYKLAMEAYDQAFGLMRDAYMP